jgi:cytochrome P450
MLTFGQRNFSASQVLFHCWAAHILESTRLFIHSFMSAKNMTSVGDTRGEFSFVATSTCFVVAASLLVGYTLKKKSTEKTFPMAPTGILESIQGITRPDAPFFILDLSKKLGTLNFRLPVPLSLQGVHVIGDTQFAKQILSDRNTTKPRAFYREFDSVFRGRQLFGQPNNDYSKAIRKSTAHAFSKNEVGRMNVIALKYVNEWLDGRMKQLADSGGTFDPAQEMTRITFLTICESAFEYQASGEEFEEFAHCVEVGLREYGFKQTTNPLRGTIFGKLIPSVREADRCCVKGIEFARRILEAYRKNPNKSKQNTLIKLIEGADILTNNDEEKATNTYMYLIAGMDTTGYTLSNAMIFLAKHQAVQEKLRGELANAGDKRPEDVPYFGCVIKESYRKLPIAAMNPLRQVGRAFELDGMVVPKGALVLTPQILTNYDSRLFEDPETYRPERWENASKEMLEASHPFSYGTRNCVGQSLAMAEINSIFPKLISRYALDLVDEGKPDFFLTFKFLGARLKVREV